MNRTGPVEAQAADAALGRDQDVVGHTTTFVTPAKAGAKPKEKQFWVPAFAGMTRSGFIAATGPG